MAHVGELSLNPPEKIDAEENAGEDERLINDRVIVNIENEADDDVTARNEARRTTDVETNTFRPSNLYIAARKRVHRVIDVALFISNMTGLATIAVRRFEYEGYQVGLLVSAYILSMTAQVVAGVCFFIAHQRELGELSPRRAFDYVAYGCVGAVMILNIFIAAFVPAWLPTHPEKAYTSS